MGNTKCEHPLYFIPNLGTKIIFLFRHNKCELLPIKVSRRFTTSLIMDLLLLTDGSKYHYVLISDFQKLVEYLRHKVHRFQSEICRKRFHTCASFETLRRHQELCFQDEDVVKTMPKPGKYDFLVRTQSSLVRTQNNLL